jgi:Leucine Rich repeat
LADNTAVTMLLLSDNYVGDEECVDFAAALIKNRVLTSIGLDENLIGDDGCSSIASALRANTVLTRISLNGNKIGEAGGMALAETLRINASLQELGLGRNRIGNGGTIAIADALKFNTAMDRLDLSDNAISDEGALALLTALERSNHSLTSLNLDNNPEISPVLQKAIGFILASRVVLNSFRKCLPRPLEKQMIPLVIHAVRRNSFYHEKLELAPRQKCGAGPLFLLVRAAALSDSKIIKVTAPSRKRSRMA